MLSSSATASDLPKTPLYISILYTSPTPTPDQLGLALTPLLTLYAV